VLKTYVSTGKIVATKIRFRVVSRHNILQIILQFLVTRREEFHLRNVHPRNKRTYATSDVRSSRDHVGGMRNAGINGTNSEPMIQPPTSTPNLEE
jgi:hypothetical protein